ncbi:hypothetical protein [Arcobacter sp. F2176]|uniref:hypothetical protein n=1 Tax=Arcobacter sp. F2176 TaxID=2044511 RepID=UPI00100B0A5D|nr:hypothetical protein [Arcobacter sp. F2176]RXJ79338.1 hypothetical protein CRU95_14465 [Arcobacter sp. F2176]
MPNSYTVSALYIPAFILLIPIYLIFQMHEVNIIELFNKLDTLNLTWNEISISSNLVLWIFLANLIRYIGKHQLENKIFNFGRTFPTTQFLKKKSNILSQSFKNRIFELIYNDFNFDISKLNNMNKDEEELELKDYVSQIRIKVGKGTLTFNHNVRYGQIRNFIGGLYIILPILIINSIYIFYISKYGLIENTLLVINFLFFLIFLLKKTIIIKYADEYANMLFNDYINLQRS